MHNLKKKSYRGFGSWLQCSLCGCTYHSNFWWIGGYKSPEEPICNDYPGLPEEWKKNAILATYEPFKNIGTCEQRKLV